MSSKNRNNHSRRFKHRLKSATVRDANSSMTTFRQFYQSGGRDYEHYRLWLQTLSNPEQLSISSVDLDKVKIEPIDVEVNVNARLPSSPPSMHSRQSLTIPRIPCAHSLHKPVQHLPLPLLALSPSQLITTPFKPQFLLPYDHSHFPIMPMPPSPLINWSVSDVGQFIEKHFPGKNIARKFIQQKIDGHTLPLLTEDHLTRIFKMKLGPALHLLALISHIQNYQ